MKRPRSSKNFPTTISIILIAVVVMMFIISGIFKQCKVERRFDVMVSTPYIGPRINGCEVIMVMISDEGGAFHNAGIRSGDVLLDTTFRWVQNYLESFDLASGTKFNINTIPGGYKANNCEELSKFPRVTRVVIAP